ncbi:MAG: pyridoxamine 5'-phosphate oxidase family protein [Candidatus Krumholzibacteriia bacterium]
MDIRHLEDAVAIARRKGPLIIATTGRDGTPHVATAASLARSGADRLEVTAWFCATTMDNLASNPRLTLVVRPPDGSHGYQIVGTVESVSEDAMLDGWVPGERPVTAREPDATGPADPDRPAAEPPPTSSPVAWSPPVPQVRRVLLLRPDGVFGFTDAPHADQSLSG